MKVMMLQRPQLLAASALLIIAALVMPARAQYVEDSVFIGGSWVGSLAYNPSANVVYGCCEVQHGLFFAISCSTNQVLSSWAVSSPVNVAYSTFRNKAYCTLYNYGEDSVLVISGLTHQRIKGLYVPGALTSVWDPVDDRLYVACGDYNRIVMIDCRRDSVMGYIFCAGYPLKMYVNVPHRKLYTLNDDGLSVSVFDLMTRRELQTWGWGRVPWSGCYSEGLDRFYFGAELESIPVLSGSTDSVTGYIRTSSGPVLSIATADASNRVFLGVKNPWGGDPDTVMVADATTNQILYRHAVPREPWVMFFSTATQRLYCGHYYDTVTVFSADGSTLLHQLPVRQSAFSMAYSPRSRRLYVGHLSYGWVYVIKDTATVGIEEENRSGVPRMPGVTVLGGVMRVGRAASLVDVTGRTVVQLEAGENDVNGLARGAYFVVSDGELVGKVLLVR